MLNASYEPVNITRARRALVLLIKGVAVVEEAHDRFVHIGRKRLVFPPSTCVRRIATMVTWKRPRFVFGDLSQRSGGL